MWSWYSFWLRNAGDFLPGPIGLPWNKVPKWLLKTRCVSGNLLLLHPPVITLTSCCIGTQASGHSCEGFQTPTIPEAGRFQNYHTWVCPEQLFDTQQTIGIRYTDDDSA